MIHGFGCCWRSPKARWVLQGLRGTMPLLATGTVAAEAHAEQPATSGGGQAHGPAAASPNAATTDVLGVETRQDLLLLAGVRPCAPSASAAQRCTLAGSDTAYAGTPVGGPRVSGLARATTRLVIGVEHAVRERFGLAARLGYAFGGAPYRARGPSFLPVHAELCGLYWSSGLTLRGWMPSVSLCTGVAEVDGRVPLTLTERDPISGAPGRHAVDLWLTPGYLFAGAGAGIGYGWGAAGGVSAGLAAAWIFPTMGVALTPMVGYRLGL